VLAGLWSRVINEEIPADEVMKKFLTLFETPRFIDVFTNPPPPPPPIRMFIYMKLQRTTLSHFYYEYNYAFFSVLLISLAFSVQIFPPATCSQTPLLPTVMREIQDRTDAKQR